jgi:anti-sigma B factor antagonist
MTIEKTQNGNELIIKLGGYLDTITAPDLEAELKASIEGVSSLVFDFAQLEYVSSAGLRALLAAQKIMNRQGSMKIINVCESVQEIFEITGFNDIFTIA